MVLAFMVRLHLNPCPVETELGSVQTSKEAKVVS